MSDAGLREETLVHVDTRLEAVVLEDLNLADLFEDHGLARLVTLAFKACRIVATVLHSLETIDQSVQN